MHYFIADQNNQSKSFDMDHAERQEKGKEKIQNKDPEEFTSISKPPIDDLNFNPTTDATDSTDYTDDSDDINASDDIDVPTNIKVSIIYNHAILGDIKKL